MDEYLSFCKDEGRVPNASFKGSFSVRLSSDLHKRAAMYAEEHEMKLNAVVQEALQAYLIHTE